MLQPRILGGYLKQAVQQGILVGEVPDAKEFTFGQAIGVLRALGKEPKAISPNKEQKEWLARQQ